MSSSILAPAEQDTYTFLADAGDVVLMRLTTDMALDPLIRLYDPSGSLLSENDTTGPGATEITTHPLPVTGYYKVIVSDYGNTKTGTYWIFVQRLTTTGPQHRAIRIRVSKPIIRTSCWVGSAVVFTMPSLGIVLRMLR